jgi:hypothetical protein
VRNAALRHTAFAPDVEGIRVYGATAAPEVDTSRLPNTQGVGASRVTSARSLSSFKNAGVIGAASSARLRATPVAGSSIRHDGRHSRYVCASHGVSLASAALQFPLHDPGW